MALKKNTAIYTRNQEAEQKALADVLKSTAEGGANQTWAKGTDINSLDDGAKAEIQNSVNMRVYGTARPIFESPTASTTTTPSATTTTPKATDPQTTVRPVLGEEESSPYMTEAPTAARSYQDIRQESIARAQSYIDATEALFQSDMTRLKDQGNKQLSRGSSIMVGAGLAGSPFQQTGEQTIVNENEKIYQARTAERAKEVALMMRAGEEEADKRYQQEIENFRAERDFYTSERDKMLADKKAKTDAARASAMSTITNIATAGYSLDEMDSADYQKLLTDSGLSDFEVRAIYAKTTPEANASYQIQNGYMVGTYYDPVTKQPKVIATKLPEEYANAIKENPNLELVTTANGVYFYDTNNLEYDAEGNIILRKVTADGQQIAGEDSGDESELLSLSEASALGVPYGTTKGEAAAMGIIPGDEDTTETISAEKLAKTPEAVKLGGIVELNKSIDEYIALIREHGSASGLTPGDRALLDAAQTKITLALQKAQEMGALQEADLAVVKGLIPDVTDEGFFSSMMPNPFKAGRAIEALDQVKGYYNDDAKNYYDLLTAYGPDAASNPYVQELARQLGITPEESGGDDLDQFLDSFSEDPSMSINGSEQKVAKLVSAYPTGYKAGQCGRFVNNVTGIGMGDSYKNKMSKTDPTIGTPDNPPQPGDVFVMPYSWTGHTGIVKSVRKAKDGSWDIDVVDSNWGLDERIQYHTINSKKITGYARVGLKSEFNTTA